jgi:ring-1,2-phenylacetyl-CoA epoxidase subunit PaaA
MLALANGSDEQKSMAQDSLNRFYWPALMMFGPHDSDSAHSGKSMAWKIKRETNDKLRQKFITQTADQIKVLGLDHPDSKLQWNEAQGCYDSSELDWEEFYAVIKGNGHCNRERLNHHIKAHEEGAWVRDALSAYNKKKKMAKSNAA